MEKLQVRFIGHVFTAYWENGKLSGDFEAVSLLENGAKTFVGIAHQGYIIPEYPLEDYEYVLVLADLIFDEIVYTSQSLEYDERNDY